jgi:hypothetical protein
LQTDRDVVLVMDSEHLALQRKKACEVDLKEHLMAALEEAEGGAVMEMAFVVMTSRFLTRLWGQDT